MAARSAWSPIATRPMEEFIRALGEHQFLRTALVAGLLASLACGVMGPFVVVKRIGYLAGGIAHTVLAGMGAALYFGFSPRLGAIGAAVGAALLVGGVRLRWRTQEDTLIGATWSVGMAVGILFIAKTPGYATDLMSYLFGNILLVPTSDLGFMLGMDLLLVLVVGLYFRQFVAVAFDEEFARLRGVPVSFFYLLLLCLVAITLVLLIQVVGLILVIALLTLPAATAGFYVHSLGRMMLVSTLLGALLTSSGLALSYAPDLPPGPTIILLAGGTYLIAALTHRALARRRGKAQAGAHR